MTDPTAALKTRNEDFANVIKAKTHANAGVNKLTFTQDGYCVIPYALWQSANGMMKKDFDFLKKTLESYPGEVTMDVTSTPYIKVDMAVCTEQPYKDLLAEVKAATAVQR